MGKYFYYGSIAWVVFVLILGVGMLLSPKGNTVDETATISEGQILTEPAPVVSIGKNIYDVLERLVETPFELLIPR